MNQQDGYRALSDGGLEKVRHSTYVRTLIFYPEIASTNRTALELAAGRDLDLPALVVTNRQTAGRGRGSNSWWSAPGALTFSLILDRAKSDSTSGSTDVSLTAGLAVCDSLHQLRPGLDIGLKWPNDVFVQARKICGILVEVPPLASDRIVVGIGININNTFLDAPAAIRLSGVALVDITQYSIALHLVLLRILERLDYYLGLLARGTARLSDYWQAFCMLSGRRIEVNSGMRQIAGICRGINKDGQLLVDTGDEMETCVSGVVAIVEN